MAAICPRTARIATLQQIRDLILSSNAKAHLLGSPLVAGDATTLADCLAAEATWPGYASQLVLSWTAAVDVAGPVAQTTGFAQFSPTGSSGTVPVYGWFLTDITSAKFYLVEQFPAVLNVQKGAPYTPTFGYNLLST